MPEKTKQKRSWQERFWPIKRSELKKILPLLLLKALISFNYGIFLILKDTFVVTAGQSGAEIIPVLKAFVVFPTAIFVVSIYTKLNNHLRSSTLFYGTISIFLGIALIYAFVLLPNAHNLSPSTSADWLLSKLGQKYWYWIAVYRHWMHALFFVTAELWGQVVIFIFYWGFVNQICTVEEASRSYNLFIAAGTFACSFTGPLVLYYTKKYEAASVAASQQVLTGYIVLAGLLCMIIYWWINHYGLTQHNSSTAERTQKQKPNFSLAQSLYHVVRSPYLLAIAIMVIGCGFSINLVEVTWKANLKNFCNNHRDYQIFTATVTMYLSLISLFTTFFLSGNILRRFGWRTSAQVTPIVIGTTGTLFFFMSYWKHQLGPVAAFFNMPALQLVVIFGAFQSLISRAAKYSFFDATKEIVFIPLAREDQIKGKATIDTIGSRLGKFSSSFVHLSLLPLACSGSALLLTPLLIPILILMILAWLYAVKYLAQAMEGYQQQDT